LGGYLATRYLIDLGHRRIGLISGPDYASSAIGRRQGYLQAMQEAGLEINDKWIVGSSFSIDAGVQATDTLMSLKNRPTAVFAVNDNTAIGAMSKLTELGLRVPDDISLAGYNDVPVVSHLPVPLTSVRVPFDQIANGALDLLSMRMTDVEVPVRLATPTLIPRRSTKRWSGD
jgi:LacI family transcriptional regulator